MNDNWVLKEPVALAIVVFCQEYDDMEGTLKTIKNIFDITNPSNVLSKCAYMMNLSIFIQFSTIDSSHIMRHNKSLFVYKTLKTDIENQLKSESLINVNLTISEIIMNKDVSPYSDSIDDQWWENKCYTIWSSNTRTNLNCDENDRVFDQKPKKIMDEFRSLIKNGNECYKKKVLIDSKNYGNRDKNNKKNNNDDDEDDDDDNDDKRHFAKARYNYLPVIQCHSNSLFSRSDLNLMVAHAMVNNKIHMFDLKPSIYIDEIESVSISSKTDDPKKSASFFYQCPQSGMDLKNVFSYFPYIVYALFSFIALMCDHGQNNMASSSSSSSKSYILKFKNVGIKNEQSLKNYDDDDDNDDDGYDKKEKTTTKCLITALSKDQKKQVKCHGYLKQSALCFKYGTFFSRQLAILGTTWNGSLFAILYLFFDYTLWHRLIYSEKYNNPSVRKYDDAISNYPLILMCLFYSIQAYYCFRFLNTITLLQYGKSISIFRKTVLDIILSMTCPLFFIIFYPILWIYRRLIAKKKGLFSEFKLVSAFRNYLFQYIEEESPNSIRCDKIRWHFGDRKKSEESKRLFLSSQGHGYTEKRSCLSRWLCCCCCYYWCRSPPSSSSSSLLSDKEFIKDEKMIKTFFSSEKSK